MGNLETENSLQTWQHTYGSVLAFHKYPIHLQVLNWPVFCAYTGCLKKFLTSRNESTGIATIMFLKGFRFAKIKIFEACKFVRF